MERPWVVNYPKNWPTEYEYKGEVFPQMFEETVKEFPDRVAIVYQDNEITYREFYDLSKRFAAALYYDLGVRKGDKIGFFLPNCPGYSIGYTAVFSLGAVAVTANHMCSETELLQRFGTVKPSVVITADYLYDRVAAILNDVPTIRHVIVCNLTDWMRDSVSMFIPRLADEIVKKHENVYDFKELLEKDYPDLPKTDVTPDDPCYIMFTGGTTGLPKAQLHTHRALALECINCQIVDLDSTDENGNIIKGKEVVTGAMPMFHNGLWSAFAVPASNGATVILYPKFDAEIVIKDIERYKITHMHVVPTMLVAMLNSDKIYEYDLSSLRTITVGSAPVPTEVVQKLEKLIPECKIREFYGLTEINKIATINPYRGKWKVGSCGLPTPFVYAKIVDPKTLKELGPGEVGEILVGGSKLMEGYLNPEHNKEKLIKDDEGNIWLRTGDLGYRDEDWYFYFVDRLDDMFTVSGFNVYPKEIENVLYQFPAVREVAVIPHPDEYRGNVVKAIISLKSDYSPSESLKEEIIAFARKHLSPYKVPRIIEFVDEVPKTTVGKISRRMARELYTRK